MSFIAQLSPPWQYRTPAYCCGISPTPPDGEFLRSSAGFGGYNFFYTTKNVTPPPPPPPPPPQPPPVYQEFELLASIGCFNQWGWENEIEPQPNISVTWHFEQTKITVKQVRVGNSWQYQDTVIDKEKFSFQKTLTYGEHSPLAIYNWGLAQTPPIENNNLLLLPVRRFVNAQQGNWADGAYRLSISTYISLDPDEANPILTSIPTFQP